MIEKDWITDAGLRAVVLALPLGHRCGYVAVQHEHPAYGKGYDDVDVEAHGGLTYAGGEDDYPAEGKGVWWFGYDCAHYLDALDPAIMSEEYKKLFFKWPALSLRETATLRDTAYCVAECEALAKQLKELT